MSPLGATTLLRAAAVAVAGGGLAAAGVTAAFRVIPTSAARVRYVIAVAAFLASAAIPWMAANRSVSVEAVALPRIVSTSISPAAAAMVDRAAHWHSAAAAPWVWLGVASLLVAREAGGHVRLFRARKTWEPAPAAVRAALGWPETVPLYFHAQTGPSAVGWLRTRVVLPWRILREVPVDAARRVARHELAHARWRDPAVHALLRLVRAVLWFSPALWWLDARAHAEREAAADAWSIGETPDEAARRQAVIDYAESLVLVAAWPTGSQRAGVHAVRTAMLEGRLERLFATPVRPSGLRLAAGIAAAIIAMGASTLMSAALAPGSAVGPLRIEMRGARAFLVTGEGSGRVEEEIVRENLRAAAIHTVTPQDPDRSGRLEGIQVFLVIDERGEVIRARADAGDRSADRERAAVEAARQWRFRPARLGGKPAKAVGTLTFFGSIPAPKGWYKLH